MFRTIGILCARLALIFAVVPIAVYGYEFGPDPGYAGGPGDGTCVACHGGTANSGPGSVTISSPSGNSYVPGQAMQILVTIADSSKVGLGFQMTARMGTANTQAGDFNTGDSLTQVLCTDSIFATQIPKANGSACPAKSPTEYIEHTLAGFTASTKVSPKGTYAYSFSWTAPPAGSGPVKMYAAGNAGPGLPAVVSPTNVYTSTLTLTEGASAPPTSPTIAGVADAESARASFAEGQWVALYGSNLAGSTREWGDADFKNGTALPTSLDGVSVTIGGKAAAVYYISPTQVDVQAPAALTLGKVPVVLTYNGQVSATFQGTVAAASPSFFQYSASGKIYAVGLHANNNVLIGNPGVLSGRATERAHPGETIELFANGIAPSTAGVIVSATQFQGTVTVKAGTTALKVEATYLVYAGEYQVNVTIPANLAAGDYALSMTVPNGTTDDAGITYFLAVGP